MPTGSASASGSGSAKPLLFEVEEANIVEVVELVVVVVVVLVVVELVVELEQTFANWLCFCFRFWFGRPLLFEVARVDGILQPLPRVVDVVELVVGVVVVVELVVELEQTFVDWLSFRFRLWLCRPPG